jgi:hypothetical protein
MADDAHGLSPEFLDQFDRTGRMANPLSLSVGTREGVAATAGLVAGFLAGARIASHVTPPTGNEDDRVRRLEAGIVLATTAASTAGAVALASTPERRMVAAPVAVGGALVSFGFVAFMASRDWGSPDAGMGWIFLGVPAAAVATGVITTLATNAIMEGGGRKKSKRSKR